MPALPAAAARAMPSASAALSSAAKLSPTPKRAIRSGRSPAVAASSGSPACIASLKTTGTLSWREGRSRKSAWPSNAATVAGFT